jgi:hypothetical protein
MHFPLVARRLWCMNMIMELLTGLRALIARHAESEAAR